MRKQGWLMVFLVVAGAIFLVSYLSDNLLNKVLVATLYRPEWLLAALVGGILSHGLTKQKSSVVIGVSGVATFYATCAALGLPVSVKAVWQDGWQWLGTWWDLIPLANAFGQAVIGLVLAACLFPIVEE